MTFAKKEYKIPEKEKKKEVILMKTYNSPLVLQRADPYVIKVNGTYYFTGSCPEFDRIELRRADTINGLTDAKAKVVWIKHAFGDMASNIWAPELHYIMGKWVIYFAAGENPKGWKIRPYALVCDGDDPMTGNWIEAGAIQAADDDPYSFRDFSLDMTVFENKGVWYAVWAQKSGKHFDISDLYIAELKTPTRLKTVRRLLTTPDYEWERVMFWVNEGPSVLHHNGKIFLTYSASGTGDMYCMGMLTADENADLLDRNSWKKRTQPILASIPALKIYGPGHNCFVKGDEEEDLCILHFRDYAKIKGDPLADHNRHAHAIKVEYDENDEPVLSPKKEELYNLSVTDEVQKGIND